MHVLANLLTELAEERGAVIGSERPPFLAAGAVPVLNRRISS